eukprot:scaffold75643_cov20-Tisochrysis_lutea.AAC.6
MSCKIQGSQGSHRPVCHAHRCHKGSAQPAYCCLRRRLHRETDPHCGSGAGRPHKPAAHHP